MRIAVTGKQGQVAQSLAEIGPDEGVEIVLVGRPEFDLQDPSTVYEAISRAKPDIVVSAAAYTAVDKAESERDLAFAVNAAGAGAVAAAAARLGVPIIHLSTDYVFDGSLDRPYREDDEVGPASVYGASKLEGERLVASATPDHVIFRTAWVYSPFGNNFVKTMLRLGETRGEVGVVADQIGCPTSALDIAEAIIAVAAKLAAEPSSALRGIFHLTGSGQASWADFAEHIFRSAEVSGRTPVKVNRITTADYPTPARRPANSRLSGEKLQQRYEIQLPDWRGSADRVIRRLLSDV
ncbi:dTDP-4-dehydrorhamnose reductase [Rhizobium sp. LjRoot254]|uniref:dTDP-4-dehydrorhamnose reductase n=1 Tax=Rhizobium sp. LjRoot254 TaxID=3342297 RepID=UPI003ECD3B37